MSTKYEIMNYVTKPLIAGSLMYGYSVFVDGKSISDETAWYDSALFALAQLTSKLVDDLLLNNVDLNLFSAVGMIFEPVITAFVYTYLYDNVFRSNYQQLSNRNWNTNFMLAFALNIITTFVHNPLLGFFTGVKMF